jgi:hypothetical protein
MDPGVPDHAAPASTARAPVVASVAAAEHHQPGFRCLKRCPDPTRPLPLIVVTTPGVAHRVVASTGLYDGRGSASASPLGRHLLRLRGTSHGPRGALCPWRRCPDASMLCQARVRHL